MTKSKKLTFKLFRGQNVPASRVENERAGGAKNEKSISEAARLLDRWEYSSVPNRSVGWNKPASGKILKKHLTCRPK